MIEVVHGDCLDVLPTLVAGSIDAIVVDPPYGTQVDRDGYGRRQKGGRFIAGDRDLSVLSGILTEAPRILKPDSWVALFCSPKRRFEVETLCRESGFPVAGEVVWDKVIAGLGGGIRYQHETVLLCRHGEPSGRAPMFSVLRASHGFNGKPRFHVHEKPVEPTRRLVEYCCPPGGIVLDPCAGSGSTLVACLKSGRRGMGIEIDGRLIPTIRRRIRDAETPLFGSFLV